MEKNFSTKSGQKIQFELKVSKKAAHVYLKITPEKGLEVVIPKKFSLNKLPDILEKKQDWIQKTLQKFLHQKKTLPAFQSGARIFVLGKSKTLQLFQHKNLRPKIVETDKEIALYFQGTFDYAKKILERHFLLLAKQYLPARTEQISKIMGLYYKNVRVKSHRSRWGSCSREKNINYNWRLILKPAEIIDYVIVHELAHTVHLNHSKKFYELVQEFCPDYKFYREQLKEGSTFI